MADMEYFPDEEAPEEEERVEERPNRTFIILVSVLGGLLALAICVFGVWAIVLAPRLRGPVEDVNEAIQATNQAIETAVAQTATAAAMPTPEPTTTLVPTDTPEPTSTPTLPPTRVITATPGEADTGTAVASPALSATATPTGEGAVPKTGIGALGAGMLGIGLLAVLVIVRRLRRAA